VSNEAPRRVGGAGLTQVEDMPPFIHELVDRVRARLATDPPRLQVGAGVPPPVEAPPPPPAPTERRSGRGRHPHARGGGVGAALQAGLTGDR